MTDAAVGRIRGAPEGSPQWISWREAITPLSRASRRRWVVFYVLLLLASGALAGWGEELGLEGFGPPIVAVIALFLVFGMLRRGTRRLAAIDRPSLDERDRQELSSAFRYAYPLFLAVMVASLAVLALTLPDAERQSRGDGFTSIHTGHFLGDVALVGLLVWGFLWAVFLPTAVLAWREPDPVLGDPVDDQGVLDGPSEAARDLALAAALVAAVVIEATDGYAYISLLLLVAALAALAAWWRHAFGQQAVSSTLQAAGIFLAIMGAALLIVAAFGGGATTTAWISATGMMLVGAPLVALGRKRA